MDLNRTMDGVHVVRIHVAIWIIHLFLLSINNTSSTWHTVTGHHSRLCFATPAAWGRIPQCSWLLSVPSDCSLTWHEFYPTWCSLAVCSGCFSWIDLSSEQSAAGSRRCMDSRIQCESATVGLLVMQAFVWSAAREVG